MERPVLHAFKERVLEPRKFIQVLVGPRQVGKTTMIVQLLKKITIPYIFESADAISAASSTWIKQIWDRAYLEMKSQESREFLIVIDGIQKIQNWSETIKYFWDSDTHQDNNIKLVLLVHQGF